MLYNQYIENDCNDVISSIPLKKFKNKKILILGSNSFLASYVLAILMKANKKQKLNIKVNCCSKNKPHSLFKEILKNNKKIINFKKLNLENINLFKNKLLNIKYDYIFHFATYGQPEKWSNNFSSTIILNTTLLEELIKFSKKNKSKLMYFSSADVYKESKKIINENSEIGFSDDPARSIYSISKILGEKICKIYKEKYKFKTYIVRPGHTYGPGQTINDRRFISQIIKRALNEREVYIFGNGKSVKTWGYISEICSMILNIIQYGKSDIYNTTGKDFLSIFKIAKLIAKQSKVKFSIKQNSKAFTSKDYRKVLLTSKKYNDEFKLKMKRINVNTGIKKFLSWSKMN